MANGIGTVQVKRERGKLVVQGLGATPRGQKYVKENVVLVAPHMSSPNFKGQLSTAVKQMLPEEGTQD